MSPSAATMNNITMLRNMKEKWEKEEPDWSLPPRSPSPTSDAWEKKLWQVGYFLFDSCHWSWCWNISLFVRHPQATTESLPSSPGSLPQPESVTSKIFESYSTTTSSHHGVDIAASLHMSLLWHVTASILRKIFNHLPRVTGTLYNDHSLRQPALYLTNYDFYKAILLSHICSKLFYNIELV